MGTHKGYVQIWDAAAGKKLSTLEGHTARVGELRDQSQEGILFIFLSFWISDPEVFFFSIQMFPVIFDFTAVLV